MSSASHRNFLENTLKRFLVSFVVPVAITALFVISASAQAPSLPPPPTPSYQFSSDGSSVCIPVEVVADGLVFVQAKINGHLAWFILDNATQGFTVDRDYAQQIFLQSSSKASARGGGSNAIEAGIVRNVQIGLPGLMLTNRNLIAIALKPLESAVGHTVDGIIGSRLFDDFVVVVDYEHRCLSIYRADEYKPSGKERILPVVVDQHGFQFMNATIGLPGIRPISGRFLIDGGANTYADIYKPFSEAHQIPPPTMKLLDEPGTSTGGKTQSSEGRADWIEIGSYSIKSPPITFGQDVEGLMASSDYAGLIGAQFLERFTVVFDNPGKRILLTPNRKYEDRAEYDESGLRIRADGPGFHRFVVTRIVPDSPANNAGIESDDIIVSIDNHPTQELSLTEIRSMFRRPNAHYTIGIIRGNSQLQIPIQLRPLL